MDIAFVSNVVYPFVTGGAEKRIYEIGKRLVNSGHNVTVYGRHFWNGPRKTIHEGMTLCGVSPERDLYTDESGRRSITEALEFAKDIVDPLRRNMDTHDVVVASVFPYFPVLTAELSTLGTGTPLVTTWHEVWGDYWDDYMGSLAPFGKIVERVTARIPQHPIAVSGVTADQLAQYGQSQDHIQIIPNGIDYDWIQSVDAAEDGYEVLFVGRLIKDKQVDILLEAFDHIATDGVTLGIVGDGPQREALEAQAKSLDSQEQISFLGFLDDYEDVLAQMQAARVFASPSTREGFGITYVEAMAAGCTVIGANHPHSAASEVLGPSGLLANPTEQSVARELKRALDGYKPTENPELRAEQFDWKHIANDAAEAYRDAASGAW